MNLKRFALRGLIILAVAVAVCMYFARTVQTITTPKVRLVTASTGRFEEKMSFEGSVYFPETEAFTVEEAAQTNLHVQKLKVRPGQWVNEGDVLFTCEVPGQKEAMEKLQADYDAKSEELLQLDVENRKLSRSSEQNDLYDTMAASQKKLYTLMAQAKTIAARNGVTISGEVSNWTRQLNAQRDVPDEVRTAVGLTVAAADKLQEDQQAYYAILEDRKRKVGSDTFEYIRKRNKLIEEMDEISGNMVEQTLTFERLQHVAAARDGYVVSLGVAEGDTYDGSKAAYTLSGVDAVPVLRAPLGDVTRVISEGTRADIALDGESTERSTVERLQIDTDGVKYLWVTLPSDVTAPNTTRLRNLMGATVNVSISYRAQSNSTLLVPSAVRNEGAGSDYVYLIQRSYGDGFMNDASMKVVKTSVTVLERGDKVVSIAEDFSYQQIADREDRALSDGQTVMEYVN